MLITIEMTEEELTYVIDSVKENEELVKSLTNQKDKALSEAKNKKEIEEKIKSFYELTNNCKNYIVSVLAIFASIVTEMIKHPTKIKEHFEKIKSMNKDELKKVDKYILGVDEFIKSIKEKDNRNYEIFKEPINEVVCSLNDTRKFLLSSYFDTTNDNNFIETNFDALFLKVNRIYKNLKRLYSDLNDVITKGELSKYKVRYSELE